MRLFTKIISVCLVTITASLSSQQLETAKNYPQWVRIEKVDAFSGTKYTEFSLIGAFLTAPQNHSEGPPRLVLHCIAREHHNGKNVYHGDLLSAHLNTGTVLNRTTAGFPVMYRLDDGKAQSEEWDGSTDGTAVFFNQMTLDTILYSHYLPHRKDTNPPVKKFVIAADEAFAARIVMQFDLPSPAEVEQLCGVTYEKS